MSIKKHIPFVTLVLATGLMFTACQKDDLSADKVNFSSDNFDVNITVDGDFESHDMFTNDDNLNGHRDGEAELNGVILGGSSSNGTVTSRPTGGGSGGDGGSHDIGDSEDLSESGTSKNKPKNSGSGN